MKYIFLSILSLFLISVPIQDPVPSKKDNIYVEFLTDCNWLIYGLEGKFKLHPQHNNAVGFRSWTPYISSEDETGKGLWIWRNVNFLLGIRDYMVFPWSSIKIEYPFEPGTMPKWDFVVYYNEMNGTGVENAETHMRVWGPCEVIRLYHGEALIKHGDKEEYVKVDENDYLNFPPWQITLR